jgi:hypothetical protein
VVRKRSNRRRMLEQLVVDCSRFDFNEEESLAYINGRTGGNGIERSQFYAIKKQIKNNEPQDCQIRLVQHAKSGYLVNHFKRMDEAEHLQSILFKVLHNETTKPLSKQSPFAIFKIACAITTNSQYMYMLNIASPIIDQMREYIHKSLESSNKYKQPSTSDMLLPPSAMVLPEGFFGVQKPSDDKYKDRVFSKERKTPRMTF